MPPATPTPSTPNPNNLPTAAPNPAPPASVAPAATTPPTETAPLSPVEAELQTLIRARYPLIYVVSWEERRVEETLRDICQRRGKKMMLWTYTTGMAGNVASRDPLAALDYIMGAPDQTVFVLKDFHPFISDVAVTRRLRDLVYALKTSYKTLILLSPLLKLPPELEKEITVVDYQLPTLAEIDRLLENIIQSVRNRPEIKTDMTPLEREQVLKAASGLTSNEAENVFAKSLVEKRKFDIDIILGEKEQIIRKSGILEYYRASEAFADVGGMDLLKNWMTRRTASFTDEAKRYGLPDPKGILLLGVQGCGKSLSAKAIASLWRLPLLRLDVGKVFAGIVGSSEENMRKAIATAESVAPCVAGDTRITLADGSERTILDLWESKDATLSVMAMQTDYSLAPVPVRAITRRPAPDLSTVRLRHGQLQATSNHLHPVLRNGSLVWVRTDELSQADYVAVPRDLPKKQAADFDAPNVVRVNNKQDEIGFAPADCEEDVIPIGDLLRQAREALGVKQSGFAHTSASLVQRYETGLAHPNRARLASLINELEQAAERANPNNTPLHALQALLQAPITWSQLVSVTEASTPDFVYDLVCDAPHNFIANGIVTHNCILWIDELEKGFAGTQSSPFSDGGTTSRVFGSFITWLQEKEAACFVVATSNDVSQLPPELMRKGRFDEIFFVDLPAAQERREIFAIHLKKRGRDPKNFDLDKLANITVGYSGAEIEQVVVAALFASFAENMREVTTDDLFKTAKESIPLSVTMREGIQKLRDWAETRARPSSSESAETTEELAGLEAANRYDTSPEMLRRAALAASAAPYAMDAEDNLPSRVEALERKTATGLDSMMHTTQNDSHNQTPPAPALSKVEAEGTGAPVEGGADSASGDTDVAASEEAETSASKTGEPA